MAPVFHDGPHCFLPRLYLTSTIKQKDIVVIQTKRELAIRPKIGLMSEAIVSLGIETIIFERELHLAFVVLAEGEAIRKSKFFSD